MAMARVVRPALVVVGAAAASLTHASGGAGGGALVSGAAQVRAHGLAESLVGASAAVLGSASSGPPEGEKIIAGIVDELGNLESWRKVTYPGWHKRFNAEASHALLKSERWALCNAFERAMQEKLFEPFGILRTVWRELPSAAELWRKDDRPEAFQSPRRFLSVVGKAAVSANLGGFVERMRALHQSLRSWPDHDTIEGQQSYCDTVFPRDTATITKLARDFDATPVKRASHDESGRVREAFEEVTQLLREEARTPTLVQQDPKHARAKIDRTSASDRALAAQEARRQLDEVRATAGRVADRFKVLHRVTKYVGVQLLSRELSLDGDEKVDAAQPVMRLEEVLKELKRVSEAVSQVEAVREAASKLLTGETDSWCKAASMTALEWETFTGRVGSWTRRVTRVTSWTLVTELLEQLGIEDIQRELQNVADVDWVTMTARLLEVKARLRKVFENVEPAAVLEWNAAHTEEVSEDEATTAAPELKPIRAEDVSEDEATTAAPELNLIRAEDAAEDLIPFEFIHAEEVSEDEKLHPIRAEEAAEHLIPFEFAWNHGGNSVFVTGSFQNWTEPGTELARTAAGFAVVLGLPRGVHQYKFIVDGKWRAAPDKPQTPNAFGGVNNELDLTEATAAIWAMRRSFDEFLRKDIKPRVSGFLEASRAGKPGLAEQLEHERTRMKKAVDALFSEEVEPLVSGLLKAASIDKLGFADQLERESTVSTAQLSNQLKRMLVEHMTEAVNALFSTLQPLEREPREREV